MKKKKGHLGLSNSFHYTLMVLPGYIWLFMFSIVPMVGIVMAFQDYNPSKGWFGSPWVGMIPDGYPGCKTGTCQHTDHCNCKGYPEYHHSAGVRTAAE